VDVLEHWVVGVHPVVFVLLVVVVFAESGKEGDENGLENAGQHRELTPLQRVAHTPVHLGLGLAKQQNRIG
jgi:hypothetical protein